MGALAHTDGGQCRMLVVAAQSAVLQRILGLCLDSVGKCAIISYAICHGAVWEATPLVPRTCHLL